MNKSPDLDTRIMQGAACIFGGFALLTGCVELWGGNYLHAMTNFVVAATNAMLFLAQGYVRQTRETLRRLRNEG